MPPTPRGRSRAERSICKRGQVQPSSFLSIPLVSALAVNAFLLLGEEPVLVDAGMAREGDEFLEALSAVIDPAKLRWIWLSPDDAMLPEAPPFAEPDSHAFAQIATALAASSPPRWRS